MKIRNTIFLFILFLMPFSGIFGQSIDKDIFHDKDGNTYHQIFLDFKVKEILELKYATDSLPVDGKLSVDGYSIIIKNYPGDKSIKAKLIDEKGEEKEVSKSRCFIDPVILNL